MNAVRGLDLFAIPVSLTYKGKRFFDTLLGGFVSLILILVLSTYATMTLYNHLTSPQLFG